MNRVIRPIPEGIYNVPEGAVIYDGHVDYIADEDPPKDAVYVCKAEPTLDAKGAKVSDFTVVKDDTAALDLTPHTFAGWPVPGE